MPHLETFREGWQSENLARAILYPVAFLMQPVNIADDIGNDLLCTLLRRETVNNKINLIPQNSFMLQVKSRNNSSQEKVSLRKSISMLWELELPYFIGIVDRNRQRLTIFSGHYLTYFFTDRGNPLNAEDMRATPHLLGKLYAKLYTTKMKESLLSKHTLDIEEWGSEELSIYKSLCMDNTVPFFELMEIELTEFDNDHDRTRIHECFSILSQRCSLIQQNISSRTSKKFIYQLPDTKQSRVLSGSESIKHYQVNFYNTLHAALLNYQLKLEYYVGLLTQGTATRLDILKLNLNSEFEMYESTILKIKDMASTDLNCKEILNTITPVYNRLKELLASLYPF